MYVNVVSMENMYLAYNKCGKDRRSYTLSISKLLHALYILGLIGFGTVVLAHCP